jgi:hypothetical protein
MRTKESHKREKAAKRADEKADAQARKRNKRAQPQTMAMASRGVMVGGLVALLFFVLVQALLLPPAPTTASTVAVNSSASVDISAAPTDEGINGSMKANVTEPVAVEANAEGAAEYTASAAGGSEEPEQTRPPRRGGLRGMWRGLKAAARKVVKGT